MLKKSLLSVNINSVFTKTILVIPDMQLKPNIDLRFAYAIGCYLRDKQPDILVNLGDMADMPSLSSYDKGKKSHEGRRYLNDIESVVTGQEILFDPLEQSNTKKIIYEPEKIFLMGNHEDRINRAVQLDASLDGTINLTEDLELDRFWNRVYEFLQVVNIQKIAFSHYFGTGVMNRPASTAQVQLNKLHMSCISGHQPGRQTFTARAADGRLLTSIIAGSSYDYDLDYMGHQGNRHWRGIIMLHNAADGQFDEVYIPTHYLINKYCKGMPAVRYSPKRRKSDPLEA